MSESSNERKGIVQKGDPMSTGALRFMAWLSAAGIALASLHFASGVVAGFCIGVVFSFCLGSVIKVAMTLFNPGQI